MYPDAVFTLFGQGVYLYGICMGLALISAILVLRFFTDYKKIDIDVQNFVFYTAIGAIAGGFFCAAMWQSVLNYIEDGVFEIGAISVMPGIVGGTVTFVAIYFGIGKHLFKNRRHIEEFHKIFNACPCAILIAQSIGRVGCSFAGCCYGSETDSWFSMYNNGSYRIPTQLMEAFFLFAVFLVASYCYFKDKRITFPIYLIAYGFWRFIIEFFRTDDRGTLFTFIDISPSQFTSLLYIIAGIAITVIHIYVRNGKIKQTSFLAFNFKESVDYQTKPVKENNAKSL